MMTRVIFGADGDPANPGYTWGDGNGDVLGGGHGDGRLFDYDSGGILLCFGFGANHGDEEGAGTGGVLNYDTDYLDDLY